METETSRPRCDARGEVATSWWRLLIGNSPRLGHCRTSRLWCRHFLVAAIDWKLAFLTNNLLLRQWRVATSWWRLLIGNLHLKLALMLQSFLGRHFLVAAIDWKPARRMPPRRSECRVATSWWRLLIGNRGDRCGAQFYRTFCRHFLVAAIDWKPCHNRQSDILATMKSRHFLVAAIDWKPSTGSDFA